MTLTNGNHRSTRTSRRKKTKYSSTHAKAAKQKQHCINPKCGRLVKNIRNHFQQSPQCLKYLNELNKAKTQPNPQQRRSQRVLTRDKLCPNNKSNSTLHIQSSNDANHDLSLIHI